MVEQLFRKTTPIIVSGAEKKHDLHSLPTQPENLRGLNLDGLDVPDIATDWRRRLVTNPLDADLHWVAVFVDNRQAISNDRRMTTNLWRNAERRSILARDRDVPVARHIGRCRPITRVRGES
jgi:hypothetical protein